LLIDGRSIDPGTELRTRVAIIGAGAAGITIARELARDGVPSLLLESGGLQLDAQSQALYEGEVEGPLDESYLTTSRLRYFGGTTNHWGGNCRPLDAIDFEQRAWVPNSGWPIGPSDLAPYYDRAAPVCEIAPFPNPLGALPGLAEPPLDLAEDSHLQNTTFHRSRPTRFGPQYREDLESSQSVRVVLHATVLGIETTPEGSRVERLRVASEVDREWAVVPEIVILATGAVENARILLLSATPHPGPHASGVGNANDLVGRYFAEHAVIKKVATALCWRPEAAWRLYMDARSYGSMVGRAWGVLSPSVDTLRREELRNCTLMIQKLKKRVEAQKKVASVAGSLDNGRSPAASVPTSAVTVHTAFETEPHPDNRITLLRELDWLGQRKVRLRWIPTPDDLASIRRNLELFALDLGASGLGRLHISDRIRIEKVRGNNHHLGTTRMHTSPKLGVVDPNCRVHDVDNLYLAGSSVFPAFGYANPTFTIVALALRLVDHLRPKLAAPSITTAPDGGDTA